MSETIVKRGGSVQNSGSMTVETGNTTGNNYRVETHASGSSKAILNDGSTNDLVAGTKSEMVMSDQFVDVKGGQNQYVGGSKVSSVQGDVFFRFGNLNPTPYAREKTVLKEIDSYKALFEVKRTDGGGVFNSMEQSKSGQNQRCPACNQGEERSTYDTEEGNSITDQLQNLPEIKLDVLGFAGFQLPSLSLSALPMVKKQYPKTNDCKECGGTGFAPSSQGGEFEPDERKEQIGKMYEQSAPSLSKAEQDMGEGGNFVTEVAKNIVISCGTVFNDLDSIRVDPKGKLIDTGFDIDKKGMYPVQDASPLIEPKHVDDLSGGTVTVIANNKAAFIVGAGGLKIQSAGINEISGSVTNITGEQVNISSSNEVNLGGSRLNITSKALSLKPSGGQLVVDSNLAVKSNLMVQGGAMINGPLFCNGISGPMSYQLTEELLESYGTTNDKIAKIIGYWLKNTTFEMEIDGDSENICVYAQDGDPNLGKMKSGGKFKIKPVSDVVIKSIGDAGPEAQSVRLYSHRHVFRNINLNLDGNSENINEAAKGLAQNTPMAAPEVKHGLTGSEKDREVSFNEKSAYDRNNTATKSTGNEQRNVFGDFKTA